SRGGWKMSALHRLGGVFGVATLLAVVTGAGCGNDANDAQNVRGASAVSTAPGKSTLPPLAPTSKAPQRPAQASPPAEVADTSEAGTCTSVPLSSSLSSPQTTGASIVFTQSADCGGATPEYSFHLDTRGGGFVVQQKYSKTATWTWPTAGL